jgi:hypothetical protein
MLNRYILVEWVSDPALLSGPGRTPQNAWPFDAATLQLAIEYVTNVPAYIYVPDEMWAVLNTYRVLYYVLSYGSTPTPDGTWTSYAPGQLLINHPPVANAGPPRTFELDVNDQLIDPLVLDGSGSIDEDAAPSLGALRDPGPLRFKWEILNGPSVSIVPWKAANLTQASAEVLSAGTAFISAAMGTYTFRVTVQDTDTPLATSSPGVDSIEVQHTVRRLGGGVFISSPTTFAPRTFQLADNLDVPINYKVDPGLLANSAFQGGYWAELTIEEATTSSAVMSRTTPVPPTSFEGHFSWDGILDTGTRPVSGQQFDIRVRLLDYNGNAVSVPGRKTDDYQPNAIRLNVTNVTIEPAATKAVDFDKLVAGMAVVSLPITIDTPAAAQAPTSLTLEVSLLEVVLGGVSIAGLPGVVTWNGSLGGAGKVPAPDTYSLRVVAHRGGAILARSNPVDVKIVRLLIDATSPTQSVVAGVRVHAIEYNGPTMPLLTLKATIYGLPPDDAALQTRDVRLVMSYLLGNRNDVHPLPGPTGNDWQSLPAGIEEWVPVWNDFWGGDLFVFARTVVDGVLIDGKTQPAFLPQAIHGLNAPRATVRAETGGTNFDYAAFWQESHHTQFSESVAGIFGAYRLGPLTVLRTQDNGFGIAQLTMFPVPTDREIWNWRANVQNGNARLIAARAAAVAYQNQVQGQHPLAPNFTIDQLDLDTYCRYNGGHAYHDFDVPTNSWVSKPPDLAVNNSNTVLALRKRLDAGNPPPTWFP